MNDLTTDYLVIGAGATGLAFVDTLIAETDDVEVVIVDRRPAAGGHWVDAYPFVQLHQPSAYYGVNSLPLGGDVIDEEGINAGFYERASAAELCHYFEQVVTALEATGRVRFLSNTSYTGADGDEHILRSTVNGAETRVRTRRRLVDATYVESSIPATHEPPYAVSYAARHVTPNQLVDLAEPAHDFVIIGGGKTAMDVCHWLLEQAVEPHAIRWIRPRESWLVDRTYTQPLDQVASMIEFQSRLVEAAATATSGNDVALALEAHGMMHRIDPTLEAEINRGATISTSELERLRTIHHVVRAGRVRGIDTNGVRLTDGYVPTSSATIHVDCTAQGLATAVPKPMFEADRLTIQFTTLGVAPWSAATVGFVESLDVDDDERNRLCPVVPRTGLIADQLWIYDIGFRAEGVRREHPAIAEWAARSRLNPTRALAQHMDAPAVQQAIGRMFEYLEPAMANLATQTASAPA